ncbi:hypothetical protein OG271_03905 [Micromonospora rifamycinica]|uniref:hypothetical protein n=1 Tax=Micromonospora rifamycinica TaxID=291594 RepID=UPI002E2E76E1|nr:hypothetical protein [Micromonospora rifamycinica]
MDLFTADGTLDPRIGDDSHAREETRLNPGVYLSPSHGHALLVGTNMRKLVAIDLHGVIQVGEIDVVDPDHLDALAEYLRGRAAAMRDRHPRRHTR